MKLETELELQSLLDGELSERQARKVAAWAATDPEAGPLLAELKMTRAALAGAELEPTVPEGRDFYWSKIRRGIEAAELAPSRPVAGWLAAWRRLLAPAAGVALVTFLTVYTVRMYDGAGEAKRGLALVENLSEHTGTYSFRSQSENMFVVWVYDRSDETTPEPDATDEMIDQ